MDGGPDENILLEGGPRFSAEAEEGGGLDRGGALHPVDQAVLLALCLDVENSNPKDGLTKEEMFPYVERILQVTPSTPPPPFIFLLNAVFPSPWPCGL